MDYENGAVIVIITKRVLSKPSVKVPEHGQRTRASLKRPIQTILQDISGSFFRTEEHIFTSLLCECVRHPESFFAEWTDDLSAASFSYAHRHLRAEVSYSMAQWVGFQASHPLTPESGGRKAPTCRITGSLSQIFTRLGVCIVNE